VLQDYNLDGEHHPVLQHYIGEAYEQPLQHFYHHHQQQQPEAGVLHQHLSQREQQQKLDNNDVELDTIENHNSFNNIYNKQKQLYNQNNVHDYALINDDNQDFIDDNNIFINDNNDDDAYNIDVSTFASSPVLTLNDYIQQISTVNNNNNNDNYKQLECTKNLENLLNILQMNDDDDNDEQYNYNKPTDIYIN